MLDHYSIPQYAQGKHNFTIYKKHKSVIINNEMEVYTYD